MKFRLFTLLITKLLGTDKEAEKADMRLPEKVAGLGMALFLAAAAMIAAFIIKGNILFIAGAVVCVGLSIFAMLCYKNQRIYIISDEEFEYSTLFGNKKVYKFKDIKTLRKNQDSLTLFVFDGELHKVHIESSAILSRRLTDLINKSLAESNNQKEETSND